MAKIAGLLAITVCSAVLANCTTAPPTHYYGIDLRKPVPPPASLSLDQYVQVSAMAEGKGCAVGATSRDTACSSMMWELQPFVVEEANADEMLSRMPLVLIAQRASRGDKVAQLELGVRFEEGRGITRDYEAAMRLYRSASQSTGGQMPIWIPNAAYESGGSIHWMNTGPVVPGLPEARERLTALRAMMEARER